MRPVALSERLQAVVSMVTQGSRVCDVGCDHGFVSIYLIEQKISPHVLAMDVRKGPLEAARKHIGERGLERQIETRLSDGLHNYTIGEAESLVCAGMGGRLMRDILDGERRKTVSFQELILQPQSEVELFRGWLREQGYRITEEKMVEEDGKFYPMMRAVPHPMAAMTDGSQVLCKLCDRYGGYLLAQGNSVLQAYLAREERIYGEILQRLREQGVSTDKNKRRYAEVETLLRENQIAQEINRRSAVESEEQGHQE